MLATGCARLLRNRADGYQIIVEYGADVMPCESNDRLGLAGRADKFHLEPLSIVHFDDCTEVTLPQPVLGKVSIEYDGIQQFVRHHVSPGNAVMNRGVSSFDRTIQIVTTGASLPVGPRRVPRTS